MVEDTTVLVAGHIYHLAPCTLKPEKQGIWCIVLFYFSRAAGAVFAGIRCGSTSKLEHAGGAGDVALQENFHLPHIDEQVWSIPLSTRDSLLPVLPGAGAITGNECGQIVPVPLVVALPE
jgi:hypothetical protein